MHRGVFFKGRLRLGNGGLELSIPNSLKTPKCISFDKPAAHRGTSVASIVNSGMGQGLHCGGARVGVQAFPH